jgi:hypothetical protein
LFLHLLSALSLFFNHFLYLCNSNIYIIASRHHPNRFNGDPKIYQETQPPPPPPPPQPRTNNNNVPLSLIDTTHSELISNLVIIPNSSQFQLGLHTTPGQYSQTFELDLTAREEEGNGGREVLPSEMLLWVQISHAIKFRVIFEGENGWGGRKPLVVKAPLNVSFVCERERIISFHC